MSNVERPGWLSQLRDRGVLRVAASYAVIGWLLLQIADVTFEPLGLPRWAMTGLIVAVGLGFPVAVLLAWFFELGDHGITRDQAPAAASRPQVHGLRRYADVAIIGVLLVAVAVLLVRQSDLGKPPPPARPTLAVLPFTNLSADPEQQYFSDGLAEEVLDRLGQVPGMMVVARSSSFAFRGSKEDVREIAERLGVNSVLEGAVRRDGKRLRLSAKLIDGKSGFQLWSGSFDREVTDLFTVQAELAQAVINAILPVARGDTVASALNAPPPTVSLSAYDLYLLGKSKANSRWPEDMLQSVQHFERALEQDPKFAKAQAALALSRTLLIAYDDADVTSPRNERIERAEASVYQALALDPKLAESQVAYATFLRTMERDGAEAAYKRAIELNPNSAEAWHGYAVFLGNYSDRKPESKIATRKAHELDPLAASTWLNYLSLVQRPGAAEYRRELQKARIAYADDPNIMRRFAIAAGPGFPLDAWQIVTATRRSPSFNVPRYIERVGPLGLWMYVDATYIVEHGTPHIDDPEIAPSRLWLLGILISAEGILGHEQRVRDLFAMAPGIGTADERTIRCMEPFWLSVFGRYDEAAAAFATVLQYKEFEAQGPYRLGLGFDAQALPALLRTYRATGRGAEADALARTKLAEYRAAQPRKPDEEEYPHWVRDAALAANEGLKDEAVKYLRRSLNWYDTPPGFVPSLPWFRSLEGHAGYEALRGELAQRVAKLRAEMRRLDANVPLSSAGQPGAAPSRP
jgi:TolB-like protein